MNNISILSNNVIPNGTEIEVPAEKYYEFDSKGNLLDEISEDESVVANSTNICLHSVSRSIDKMWSIKDGKLVRNYIE